MVVFALACLVLSCAATQPGARTSPTAAVAPARIAGPSREPLNVAVVVLAPLRARYLPSLLGAERPALAIIVTNRSAEPVDVADLRVHLEAARQSVSFRCAKTLGPTVGAREPPVLGPAETYYEPIDVSCIGLAVPGTYEVAAGLFIARGSDGDREISMGRLRVAVVSEPSR